MKDRIDAIARGYATGEYSHPLRDHMSGEYPTYKINAPTVELYAERNGELHVLARTLLDKYRAACPDDPFVYEADSILCNVPQCRLPADAPLRRGY